MMRCEVVSLLTDFEKNTGVVAPATVEPENTNAEQNDTTAAAAAATPACDLDDWYRGSAFSCDVSNPEFGFVILKMLLFGMLVLYVPEG